MRGRWLLREPDLKIIPMEEVADYMARGEDFDVVALTPEDLSTLPPQDVENPNLSKQAESISHDLSDVDKRGPIMREGEPWRLVVIPKDWETDFSN